MPELSLNGCAPIPLARYLKALGVLRLVAESKHGDASAMAFWQGEHLVLKSRFHRETLVEFFLRDYEPTPLVVPWSGGDFFAVNRDNPASSFDEIPTSKRVIEAILSNQGSRFGRYRGVLRETFKAMDKAGVTKKKDIEGSGGLQRRLKADLLRCLRGSLPDDAVAWIDAASVVETDGVAFNALLGGGGGSDGNSHFSDNFMQSLWMALPDFESQRRNAAASKGEKSDNPSKRKKSPKPEHWEIKAVGGGVFDTRAAINESLFGTQGSGTKISGLSPVLFDNTRVGGPNQTVGFEAKADSNPWDFILMLEGSILFAGAIGRKLDDLREPSARFPFLFRSSPVGPGSSYLGESAGRELWLPLWSRSSILPEIRALLAEGRVEKHGRMAKRGTDAFVAAAQLGFDRGIDGFQRVGFFKGRIGGDNYFTAVDQGRIKPRRNEKVDLLRDADEWLTRLASAVLGDTCPASVRSAAMVLERRIADLASSSQAKSRSALMAVLTALGAAERALAKSFRWTTSKEVRIHPLAGLSTRWLEEADDGSHEFRLAAALTGVHAPLGKKPLWLRQHLEPLEMGSTKERSWVDWADQHGNDVVWHDGDLISALNAILARRLVRFEKAGTRGWPDISPRHAELENITAFIESRVDEELLTDLLWGIACVDHANVASNAQANVQNDRRMDQEAAVVPSAFYAFLKLCHHRRSQDAIPLVPAMLHRAMNRDGETAAELAIRRLRASGHSPLVDSLPVHGDLARRTAAAMLFPISDSDFWKLKQTITHKPKEENR